MAPIDDSQEDVLVAVRTAEARGWYVDRGERQHGIGAARPGYGRVTASSVGALLDAIAQREQDFSDAGAAAEAAGANFYGHAPGWGWTAVSREGKCLAAHGLQRFIALCGQGQGRPQTSAPQEDTPADAAVLLQHLEEEVTLAGGYLAPIVHQLGLETQAPCLPLSGPDLSVLFAAAVASLESLAATAGTPQSAGPLRARTACSKVREAALRFPPVQPRALRLGELPHVIDCVRDAAEALALGPSGEPVPIEEGALTALGHLLRVARGLRHLVEGVLVAHVEASSGGPHAHP
jgi:hypothetical protein